MHTILLLLKADPPVAAIPEPASGWLLGLGLIAFVCFDHWKRTRT